MLAGDLAGRGQDVLLVVNPNDEPALRISGVYQELRNVPDINIVFVSPPQNHGYDQLTLSEESFTENYVKTIHQAIEDRGLTDQIDFIAAIGQAHSFNQGNNSQSLSFGLMQLDQYFAGMTANAAQTQGSGIASKPTVGPLHHSDAYANVPGSTTGTHHYYVGGLLGVTGQFGNTTDQVIEGLRRSVAADGTKPEGTIYFEENNDIRSQTREYQWPGVQAELSARGIAYIEESNTPGATPMNRNDVRGAIIGAAEALVPNGTTYLAGSVVTNLTSFGGVFTDESQTKATAFIAAGAAASSGTIAEPTANAYRFPHAEMFTHIDSGLTLGEAHYQAVDDPDMLQFIGDILAQPYGDIAQVSLTGVESGGTVTGTFTLDANAVLPSGSDATAITRLELYVDGLLSDTLTGSQGRFTIDSTAIIDGMHELRVVAVANNLAQSEGIAIERVRVSNRGRFVSVTGQTFSGADRSTVSIPLSTTRGDGTIDRIELRHMGRVLSSVAGAADTVELALSDLAYGENSVVPVAVFTDGQEVQGARVHVHRNPPILSGQAVPSSADQTPGFRAEYFLGEGGESIATSDFSGSPDIDTRHNSVDLYYHPNSSTFATDQVDGLAMRMTGSFTVTADTAGEYLWSAISTNDSLRLSIDGQRVMGYDNLTYGLSRTNGSASTFLAPGRHDIEILSANTGTEGGMRLNVLVRGPDGKTQPLRDNLVYTFDTVTTPTLLAPSITAPVGTIDVARPSIVWTAVTDAADYQLRVVSTRDNTSLIEATVTGTTYTPAVDLDDGDYRVEVRARSGDVVSAWANATFTVGRETGTGGSEFTEDFEALDSACWSQHVNSGGYNINGCDDFTYLGKGSNVQWVETSLAHSGTHALQVTYEKNEDAGHAIYPIAFPGSEQGSEFVRTNQWMRFGENYDFGRQKIHRISGTDVHNSDYFDFDIVVALWAENVQGVNESTQIYISYNGGVHDWGADWGNYRFERERWYEITTEVKLNTPGQSDGQVRVLIDGQPVLEKSQIMIRDSSDVLIDSVMFGGWYTNGGLDPASSTRLLIDDVLVSTDPQGADSMLPTPLVTAPLGIVKAVRPSIEWTAVDGATDYQLRVVRVSDNTNVIDTTVTGNRYAPAVDLAEGEYRVEVRAQAEGKQSRSTSAHFTIDQDAARTGIVILDEGFEVRELHEVFDGVSDSGTTSRITNDDSFGDGTRAVEITYGDDRDETQMSAWLSHLAGHAGITQAQMHSIEFSFASRLPDGLPIDETERGWGGLKQSRLYNADAAMKIDGVSVIGVGDQFTKYNAHWEGPNAPATDQYVMINKASTQGRQTPLLINPTDWFTIRYFVQRNTPGNADGIYRMWINDELFVNRDDLRWTDDPNIWIDSMWLGGNLSLGGEHADHPFRRLFDDVYLAVNGEAPTDGIDPTKQIVVHQSGGNTRVIEGGADDTFSVSLASAPTQDVYVHLSTPQPNDVSVPGYSLIFTPENWNVPQSVTVSAIDDTVVEGDQQATVIAWIFPESDPYFLQAPDQHVAVTVVDNDGQSETLAALDLLIVDADGNALNQVDTGDEFFVEVYAEDLRAQATGVFSAGLDITFGTNVTTAGDAVFGDVYSKARNGDFSIAGGFDEIHAAANESPQLAKRNLLVRIPMRAQSAGAVTFAANPADMLPEHEVTLVGLQTAVPSDHIRYGSVELIVNEPAVVWYNESTPEDVNGDGSISPLDALLVINLLIEKGTVLTNTLPESYATEFYDTNNDGRVSPVDALIVLNELTLRARVVNSESPGSVAQATAAFSAGELPAPEAKDKDERAQAIDAALLSSSWFLGFDDESFGGY